MIVCHFSGMYLPSVERLQRYSERAVRYAVIEQPAYNADASVGIALCETERIRSMVIVERNLAWMIGIVFPALQSVQTVLERSVADGFGIAFYILEMFFIQDFALHSGNVLHSGFSWLIVFYLLNTSGSGSRYFLFLACLTVPWPYPQGLAKENTAAIGEDDFLSANPAGAWPCPGTLDTGLPLQGGK